MEAYNLKIITYEATGEQDIITYSNPIENKKKEKSEVDNDIEQLPPTLAEIIKKVNHSLHSSMSRTKQTIYDYARANNWEWFITFTADPKKIDRYDYDVMTKKMTKWLNRQRERKAQNMKYIIVPEKHKDGAWHFHGLFSDMGNIQFVDSGHKAKGMDIYNLPNWSLGFTTATQIKDTLKASNYITKYITKSLIELTKGRKRYWNSQNLSIGTVSKDFIDHETMTLIQGMYTEEAKRHKKIVVDKINYRNEINIITL
jgi:hypothetical protein